jgi:hypothetical protein
MLRVSIVMIPFRNHKLIHVLKSHNGSRFQMIPASETYKDSGVEIAQ